MTLVVESTDVVLGRAPAEENRDAQFAGGWQVLPFMAGGVSFIKMPN